MTRISLTLAVCALLVCASSAAEKPWIAFNGAHFEVVTDGADKKAQEVLWTFEQMHTAVAKLWPWARPDADRPLVVLLPRDEDGMKRLFFPAGDQSRTPPYSAFFVGVDRFHIITRGDLAADARKEVNPFSSAFHGYADWTLRTGVRKPLPYWATLGLASFIANSYVTDSSVEIGHPVSGYIRSLRTTRMTMAEVMATDTMTNFGNVSGKYYTFQTSAWSLVHYLVLGDEGAHREQFDRFLNLLQEGKSSSVALPVAFGDLLKLEGGWLGYLSRTVMPTIRFDVDKSIRRDVAPKGLTLAESAAVRAGFHAAMNRPAEARLEITAARTYEVTPASFEVEGLLLDRERQTAQALAAYSRAIELGSTNFYPYYRKAMLTPSTGPAMAQNEQLLERAIALNPRYTSAYVVLADLKLRLGRGPEALPLANKAVELAPNQFPPRLLLARILGGLGLREEAVRAATNALALAQTDAQRDSAQRIVDANSKP